MDQNRKPSQDEPTRSSDMEPAEGSRETIVNSESGPDLGTSSDRAMFDERMSSSGQPDKLKQGERAQESNSRDRSSE